MHRSWLILATATGYRESVQRPRSRAGASKAERRVHRCGGETQIRPFVNKSGIGVHRRFRFLVSYDSSRQRDEWKRATRPFLVVSVSTVSLT